MGGKQLAKVVIGTGVLLLVGGQRADAEREPQALRLGSALERLAVVHDGLGHYLALEDEGSSGIFYYGDGKSFYRQHVISFSETPGGESAINFWAPDAVTGGRRGGQLTKSKSGNWRVLCNASATDLEVLDDEARTELVGKAVFRAAKWQHTVRFAARDEDGRYYVVDSESDSYGQGWRLFIGKRGKLEEIRLVDVVSDSGGDIFATSKGDLSFEQRDHRRVAVWSHGRHSEELTFVPPELNTQLFYVELGLYRGGLGTPCDHF